MERERLSKEELIDLLSSKNQFSKQKNTLLVNSLLKTIEESLINGEQVRIKGLGVFKAEWHEKGSEYDPEIGDVLENKAEYKVIFVADKEFETSINEPFSHLDPVLLDKVEKNDKIEEDDIITNNEKGKYQLTEKFEQQAKEIKNLLSEINDLQDMENPEKPEKEIILERTHILELEKRKLQNLLELKHVVYEDDFNIVRDLSLIDTDETPNEVSLEKIANVIIEKSELDDTTETETLDSIQETEDAEKRLIAEDVEEDAIEEVTGEIVVDEISEKLEIDDTIEVETLDAIQKIESDNKIAFTNLKQENELPIAQSSNTDDEVKEKPKSKEQKQNDDGSKKGKIWITVFLAILLLEILGILLFFYFDKRKESLNNQKYIRTQEIADSIAFEQLQKESLDTTTNLEESLIGNEISETELVEDKITTVSSSNKDAEESEVIKENRIEKQLSVEELGNISRSFTQTIATEKMVSGSQLTKFAKKYYGNSHFWVYIYEANKNKISNPDNVPTGIDLKIPKVDQRLVDVDNPESIEFAKQLQRQYLK